MSPSPSARPASPFHRDTLVRSRIPINAIDPGSAGLWALCTTAGKRSRQAGLIHPIAREELDPGLMSPRALPSPLTRFSEQAAMADPNGSVQGYWVELIQWERHFADPGGEIFIYDTLHARVEPAPEPHREPIAFAPPRPPSPRDLRAETVAYWERRDLDERLPPSEAPPPARLNSL